MEIRRVTELENVLKNTTKAGKKKHDFSTQFSTIQTGFHPKRVYTIKLLNSTAFVIYFIGITVVKPLKSTCFDASAIVDSPRIFSVRLVSYDFLI